MRSNLRYVVLCVGRTPWTRHYRRKISNHRSLDRAIDRADRGCNREDPPTAEALTVLRTRFTVTVLRVARAVRWMPPEYEWAVVDTESGNRVYTVSADQRGHSNDIQR